MPSDQLLQDLRREEDELHEYARSVFSNFTDWWKFFVTANFGVFAAFTALENFRSYLGPLAIPIAILDSMGSGFCLLVCFRLVQISDRLGEITDSIYGRDETTPTRLPNRSTVRSMWEQYVREMRTEPMRSTHAPNSPLPLRFYLISVSGVMFVGCPLIALLWVFGFIGWIVSDQSTATDPSVGHVSAVSREAPGLCIVTLDSNSRSETIGNELVFYREQSANSPALTLTGMLEVVASNGQSVLARAKDFTPAEVQKAFTIANMPARKRVGFPLTATRRAGPIPA